ncbi:MAG: ankyrin repeat domain-containing protein, partial [Epsilonproteobacteria bacterium]|nr:ankyrin repeat domain-containing protein [Campylobacterota bacterium]
VKLLLAKEGIDINKPNQNGWTPLNTAAAKGHDKVVKLLLGKEGIDINKPQQSGATPLIIAALKGHDKVVELLLAKEGIKINEPTQNGCTPLNIAAEKGHDKIVKLLLAKEGIDINKPNQNGWTPLNTAAEKGHDKVVELLINHGAYFHFINLERYENFIKKNLQLIQKKDKNGKSQLHHAAYFGDNAAIKILVEHLDVNDIDNQNLTPLHYAILAEKTDSIKTLKSKGANIKFIDQLGQAYIHHAAKTGNIEIVKLLNSYGLSFDTKDIGGKTPLYYAAEYGHTKLIEFLKANGSNINAQNEFFKETLLHLAVKDRTISAVKHLMENGADATIADGEKNTPIDWARKLLTIEAKNVNDSKLVSDAVFEKYTLSTQDKEYLVNALIAKRVGEEILKLLEKKPTKKKRKIEKLDKSEKIEESSSKRVK